MITWHSPAEMLPQVGQETWVTLQVDDVPIAYPATLTRSAYGTVAAWRVYLGPGITKELTADLVGAWCPRDALSREWGMVWLLEPEEAP